MSTLLEWTAQGTAVAIEIEATPTQGFERTAEVTEHPVESSTNVADHVKVANGVVSLEGVITNTPVLIPSTQMRGVTRATETVQVGRGEFVSVQQWSGVFNRVADCDRLLDALVVGRYVVRLTTVLRTVENLILARYKVDKDAETGESINVTLELKQLRIATTARAPVPAVRRLQPPAARGQQPADNRSALAHIEDGGAPMTRAQRVAQLRRIAQGGR